MDAIAPIVVTGAGGFIGRAVVERLAASGAPVVAVTRRPVSFAAAGIEVRASGELTAATDWAELLDGARAVVHLAARAHDADVEERQWIEGEGKTAAALARAATRAGVRRIVLMSSIKVLGEATGEFPFRAHQPAAPEDAYGLAKWSSEEAMRAMAGPILTVLRPPLVYGPGVKANFRALLRLVDRGVPLPLASVDNRRSLVFLANLVDLVLVALDHPEAAGETFLLRDDEDVSTPDLIRRIARALGRPARLSPCPPALLWIGATLVRRTYAAERLLGSLRVDDLATRSRLGWRPRVTLEHGIAETCRWYREQIAPPRPSGR
jgi:nucleoside-diphosphate-sugar epimerase